MSERNEMGLFSKDPQKTAAIQAHKAARKNLESVSSKTNDANDPAYLKANRRVIDAEKNIPWYRR